MFQSRLRSMVALSACLLPLPAGLLVGVSGAQTPGDASPLKAVHPGYTLTNLRPAALQEGIGGMDFLPDGRLAICTWNGNHDAVMTPVRKGNLYILSGVEKDNVSQVTYKKFAANLQEPLGLKAVGDTLYVSERQALIQLVDADKDGVADSSAAYAATAGYKPVATYATGANRHEYFFGLLYKDGAFYGAHSISLDNGGTAAIPQPNAGRGTFVKVDRATGKTEYLSGGGRQPYGIGWGPEGEMFATDVQGTWMPGNKLNHVKPDRFYGHYQMQQQPANPWDSRPFQPPAVWLPQGEMANAPGQPVLVPSGPFAGQMLFGDVYYGGIQRACLEKVKGEWQGAVFRFSAGFEGGVGRLVFGPDGALYVGQVGHNSGNWYEPGKKTWGLAKLKANGKSAFEMLRVLSRRTGMEIHFTEPVGDGFEDAARYTVRSFYYTPDANYGGSKKDHKSHVPKSVKVDPTGTKVFLELEGAGAGRVVHIRLSSELKGRDGKSLWSTEAFYTQNAVGEGDAFDPVVSAAPALRPAAGPALVRGAGSVSVALPGGGRFEVTLADIRGRAVKAWTGVGGAGKAATLNTAGLPGGLYLVSIRGTGISEAHRLLLP